MSWPYPNPKPLGWGLFEELTSAEMSQVNANAAAAADGSVWTDIAMTNFISSAAGSPNGVVIGWDPFYRYFYSFGGNTEGLRSRTGKIWHGLTIPDGCDLTSINMRHAFATNAAGTVMFGGQSTNGATSYARTTDGTTWSVFATSATANANVRCMRWVPFLSMFIAGFENGAIETSPTGATATWTNRSVPDSQDRTGGIADNGTIVVMGNAGTPNFLTSTDGTTWTQRTGALGGCFGVVWSSYWGKFFAYTGAGLQSSADGIAWSASGLTIPSGGHSFQTFPLCQFGRALFMMANFNSAYAALFYSIDGGATWKVADDLSTSQAGRNIHCAPHGQIVIADAGATHHASLRAGA